MRNIALYMIGCFILFACNKDAEKNNIEYGSLTDIDGHVYKTVKIGGQWWMAENLRVTQFRNGNSIQFKPYSLTDDTAWFNVDGPAFTYVNDSLFGKLYNFAAVSDAQGLAPEGWHIATDEDWKALESSLNMPEDDVQATGWRGDFQADLITSQFNRGWQAASSDRSLYGSNETGFNALPAGVRTVNGYTNIQGNTAFWWAPVAGANAPCYRYIDLMTKRIFRQFEHPGYGMSIRCVKD